MIHNDVKILSGISKRDFSSPACASEKQGEVMFKSQLGHRMTLRSVLLSLLLLDQTTPKWSGTKWITPNLVPVMTCLSQEIWKCLAGQDKSLMLFQAGGGAGGVGVGGAEMGDGDSWGSQGLSGNGSSCRHITGLFRASLSSGGLRAVRLFTWQLRAAA